jgi:hypothetical protein
MDWKEQLQAVIGAGGKEFLDVRFICMKHQDAKYAGKWFLKRLRVTLYRAEPSVPEHLSYPAYLFLREKMSASDFLKFLDSLIAKSTLSAEELAQLSDEETLKKVSVRGWDIWYEDVTLYYRDHLRSNATWGLEERLLPSWSFEGNIRPEIHEGQEALIASGAPHFPAPVNGQAWYLYGKPLPQNYSLPSIDISLDDDRAFFREIEINVKASTLQCRCEGRLLSQATLHLYTDTLQLEKRQAEPVVSFSLQGEPKTFSLVLASGENWFDKREINLSYSYLGVPKGVTVIGMDVQLGNEQPIASSPLIEAIVESDPSGLAGISGLHLKLVQGYYDDALNQSKRSFTWAIVGFIGVFVLIALAIVFLLRLPENLSYIAAIITALGTIPSSFLSGYMLNLHKNASERAKTYHTPLDRIQRFFIGNSACEQLQEANKEIMRQKLIEKLNDL